MYSGDYNVLWPVHTASKAMPRDGGARRSAWTSIGLAGNGGPQMPPPPRQLEWKGNSGEKELLNKS